MSVKKKNILIYFEFFRDQNLDMLMNKIRGLVENDQFPAFSNMVAFIDHKNMKPISYQDFSHPMVILPNDEKVEPEKVH